VQAAVILPNTWSYVDMGDFVHVLGEVQNISASVLHLVVITVDFLDGSGNPVDSTYAYAYLPDLAPGVKTCFDAYLPEPANWASYKVQPPTYQTNGVLPPSLTVFDDYPYYDPSSGIYEIDGLVRNDQGSRVNSIRTVGTVYRSNDQVVGCDFSYVPGGGLDPDQVGSFSVIFMNRDYGDVTSYRIQVDGVAQAPSGPSSAR
jgi:hypothetical protein